MHDFASVPTKCPYTVYEKNFYLLFNQFILHVILIYYPSILFSRSGKESLKGLKHEMMFFSRTFHPQMMKYNGEFLFPVGKFLSQAYFAFLFLPS